MEDKAAFVAAVNAALVEHGGGRYDFLAENPLEYVDGGIVEWVVQGGKRANVTGDSLTAMLGDIDSQLF